MTTWFNYTYGVGIQLNIDCTFNVDRVSYSVYCLFWSFMVFKLVVYLGMVIHSNLHVVNPRRMRSEGYCSCRVCVSVCLSVIR